MSLKLTLRAKDRGLTVNYNYYLSAAIYKLLKLGSSEFSAFLHNKGFILHGKPYKLFCFALRFKKFSINENKIHLISNEADLYISSLLIDDFIKNIVIGTFEKQTIEIAGNYNKCSFSIIQVESIPEPKFENETYFRLLSPIVLSTAKDKEKNKLYPYYFRYYDNIKEITRILNQNLKNKFKLIYNQDYTGAGLIFRWDENYIAEKLSANKKLTRKISIPRNEGRPIEIIANKIPFYLSGSEELMKVGYYCGFGEKNSMGFGMAEVFNN